MSGRTPGPALLPTAPAGRTARFAARTLGRRCLPLAAAALAMVVEAAAGLGAPAAIGWITQLVSQHRHPAALAAPVAVLATCAAAGAVAAWLSARLLARAVLPALGRLRERVVDATVRLPIDAVEAGGGDVVSRVSTDVEEVTDVAQGALGSMLSAWIAIAVTFAGLLGLDWRFAVAALVAVPVQALTVRWYLRVSGPLYAAGRIAAGTRAGTLLESFGALPTVRAFRLGARRRHVARDASTAAVDYELGATRIMTRFYGRLNLAEALGLTAILVVAFALVSTGQTTIGQATAAALFFAGLFGPINTVLAVVDDMQRAGAGLARLVGVVDAAAAIPLPAGRPAGGGPVTACGVRFGYTPAHPVLNGVDLDLAPGARVALVGASGSGKTTLASLVAGIRVPDAGEVRYGGMPVAGIDPGVRGRHIALVAQETHVFAGTIADNLLLARPDAAPADLRRALAAVGADRWVDALPEGIDTAVGAGGYPLPPLHGQHLAFARIALLDPEVVVLDEATAEAGSEVARALDRAAAAVIAGRSALMVAHRLDQAAAADTILVMADGAVVERGRHDELVSADGPYAALWRAWARPTVGREPVEDAGWR